MPSTPDPSEILKLLDEERRVGADAGANIEKTPHVVRYLSSNWNGITYSCFPSEKADQIIGAEIDRFSRLGGTFKWKVYSHDEPRILLEKLAERGFKQGEEEALMVAPTKDLPETLFRPHSNQITIKELTDESMIDDVFAIETAVWQSTHRSREEMISNLQDSLKRDVGFIAYFKEQPAGFSRVTCSAGSQFAGLWGGSVIKEYRGRSIYRALLARRIVHAREQLSVRFLRVDALPISRRILEKYGFFKVSTGWAYEWSYD